MTSKSNPFVKMPLWWLVEAAKATNAPKVVVLAELLHCAWRTKSTTFSLPNSRLQKHGAGRETKRRVLRDLERAGLIKVERPNRKSPIVTLVVL
jgi:hypothetical protein